MLTRLAPTPSGLLHMGNACNFLVTWAYSRARGGRVLLRIDDADPNMVHPEGIADIHDTLSWLMIDIDGQLPSQQSRYGRYWSAIEELTAEAHIYACECTRSQIRAASPGGHYPGTCRDRGLAVEAPEVSLRCRVDDEFGDPVVWGKNRVPAYHVASLCDDVDAGVTHVIRGDDLTAASAVQLQIARRAPSLASFCAMSIIHHPLLLGQNGQKLSKSVHSTTLRSLRAAGLSRSAVVEAAMALADPQTGQYLAERISTRT